MLFISFVTLLIVLDYSIANIAVPYIAGGLAVSVEQGIYVITFFSIGNAIGLSMTGWLTRSFGQVRMILLSTALFTFFSWICGLSFNILMLVIARFLQGLVAGPMLPLSQAILMKEAKPENQTRDLSIWTMMVITGPVIGPLVGGYISYWYDWPWIFYINIPIGSICFFSLWLLLKDRETPTEKTASDIPGIILLAVAVTCFQIFLDKGQQWDWWASNAIRTMFCVFVVAAVFFTIRELSAKSPYFQIRLLKKFSFSFAIFLLVVSYAIYFGSIIIVPLWLQADMGYDAIKAGIAVAPLGLGPICFSMLAPKIIKKIGSVLTLGLSFALFCISAFYTSRFTTSVDIEHVGFSRFLMGLGFICYITPLIQISIQDLAQKDLPSGVGIFHFFRALSGAVGASFFTTLWQRRGAFYHERIGTRLTRFNPITPQARDDVSLTLLNQDLTIQTSMLAINEVFYLMAWLYAGALFLMLIYAFFWKEKPAAQGVANVSD